jgi:hypothetical protein
MKIRQHGRDKRRTWRKLHIAIDEETGAIVAASITQAHVNDFNQLDKVPEQIIFSSKKVTGDGAYDSHGCYEAVIKKDAIPCFPPRTNATKHTLTDESWKARNRAIGQVRNIVLKRWEKVNNYHRRSLADTTMFR